MIKYLIIAGLFLLSACQTKETGTLPTTVVRKGVFTEELTEEGIVQAVHSILITTPRISYRYGMLKIASMIEDGTEVEEGDTVLVFDPTEINKAIVNSEQQIEIARAEYEKMKATQESEIEDLEADLEITRISHQISQINFDNASFESEIRRKEIKLQMETASISLERAAEQIENKKKIHKEELLQKQLNINQMQAALKEAENALASLFVISPSRGIVIIKDNWMTGNKWQSGDQPYPGMPIIDLPDLNHMMAELKINEVDVSKISPGLKVILKSDAYSDTTYTGTISEIANLATPKEYQSKIKVFPTRVMIDGQNQKLLPGLTVSCRILVREVPDVLSVPVISVFEELGSYYIHVKNSSGFRRQEVTTAEENSDFVVITSGLEEGDEIALGNPFLTQQEEQGDEAKRNNKTSL